MLLDEINEQPDALHRTLDNIGSDLEAVTRWITRPPLDKIRRVVLTGMGSSFYAVYPALIYLVERGMVAVGMETAELLHHYMPLLDDHTLLIAISQSGFSVEMMRLIDEVGTRVPVFGITNTSTSPLAQQSDITFFLNAGAEETVTTKTYTCTLAALHMLARALTGMPLETTTSALRRTADAIGTALPGWRDQAGELAAQLKASHFLTFLGRGPSRASAMTGALVTKETAKIPTEGMIGGQFRHGPIEVISPETTTIIFTGISRTRHLDLSLAAALARLEGKVVSVGNSDQQVQDTLTVNVPASDEWRNPIAEIVPIQLLAARLAEQRGLEIGKFKYGGKITTTE
jgi:glucosamine--fructose-6-phosphate aminotransferase (isomerizing)